MRRIKLVIAYDGTNYCGWQKQPNAITVEEVINKKLTKLLGENIEVIGSSRTDSGVHALGNVAVFDTETRIPAEKISYALNQRLPEDIIIQSSSEVPLDFHPRYHKSCKTYEYKISNREFLLPTMRLYYHHVYKKLDIEKMQEAANYLIGKHDFKSFSAMRTQVQSTVRTIYSLDVIQEGDELILRVRGDGFLYNMVRIIAGTLIKVGMGTMKPERIAEVLQSTERVKVGPNAPANGLTLVNIEFKN
ncbi:tRNA pseudouridine(38-40) synthase TruA [Anaerosporobacter sp.]|uniref:tRNA pseudouridine(38-40) synthase TruA n=1 Tax=Anaerosporobacter sp. TaxID=1872529 RepID=UPI00286F86CF|nr:tRNA pseudouridine(38-40) synthase TruA [Anaerosporobacter sp.]